MAFHLFLLFSLFCISSAGSAMISSDHSIVDLDLDKFTSQEQVSSLFQLWKKEHGRVYQNQEEEAKRLEIFQRNLNYIREKNANRKSPQAHRLGLNKFADMSPEEFSKTYLQAPPKEVSPPINLGNNNINMEELKTEEHSCCAYAPACWDWRKKGVVTEVKDQGKCGECGWIFAGVGAIESINAIVTGNLVSLSEQEVIDCVRFGLPLPSLTYRTVIRNGGISTEADYPYTGEKGTCKANQTQDKVTIDDFALGGLISSPYSTEVEIERALMCTVRKQPISVTIDPKGIQFYTSGIYDGDDCTTPDDIEVSHSVLIVGYDSVDCEDYWIVKNSWGQDWGMDGYIYISRNTGKLWGVCGLSFFGSYPIKEYSETAVFKKVITPLFEV